MIIRELIEQLGGYDEDIEVCISSHGHGYEIDSLQETGQKGGMDLDDDEAKEIVLMLVEGYQKYPYGGIKD